MLQDANSSAGVFREVSPGVSDDGLLNEGPTPPVNRSRAYLESVQKWMDDMIDSNDMEPVDQPAHPIPEVNTVQNPPFTGGDWLVLEETNRRMVPEED